MRSRLELQCIGGAGELRTLQPVGGQFEGAQLERAP